MSCGIRKHWCMSLLTSAPPSTATVQWSFSRSDLKPILLWTTCIPTGDASRLLNQNCDQILKSIIEYYEDSKQLTNEYKIVYRFTKTCPVVSWFFSPHLFYLHVLGWCLFPSCWNPHVHDWPPSLLSSPGSLLSLMSLLLSQGYASFPQSPMSSSVVDIENNRCYHLNIAWF